MSKRSTSILDLADVPHWLQVAREAVSTSIPAAVRRIVVRGDPDRMYDDTISYLLRAGEAVRDCRTVAEWDQAFERVFAEFYSAIRAFHACRPESIESYKRFGIRRLCRSRAEATAIAAFSKHIAKEQIIEAVKKHPILREDEVVYCFTDQRNAKNSSANHYLQCRSEYLQAVAVGLGLHGRGILADRGSPYLIEVSVALSTLVPDSRRELWRFLITEYFKAEAGGARLSEAPKFPIAVDDDIPPDAITQFIALEDSKLDYRHERH